MSHTSFLVWLKLISGVFLRSTETIEAFHASIISQKIVVAGRNSSVLPEVIGSILQHRIDAVIIVTLLEEILDHSRVLLPLLLVTGTRLGDDAADVANRVHQLLLNGLLQRLVGGVA